VAELSLKACLDVPPPTDMYAPAKNGLDNGQCTIYIATPVSSQEVHVCCAQRIAIVCVSSAMAELASSTAIDRSGAHDFKETPYSKYNVAPAGKITCSVGHSNSGAGTDWTHATHFSRTRETTTAVVRYIK
jgi:hypothetical protein